MDDSDIKHTCTLIILLLFVHEASPAGTCASIGYSTACCPRGQNCQAANGDCFCGADCHVYGDCCTDVYCPARK